MSKQSEAKYGQGYTRNPACCRNCAHYESDITELPPAFSWSEPRKVEKNKRCGVGGFAVQSNGHCLQFRREDLS
jgi:hypothetical protein